MRIRLGIAALAAATLLAPTAGHASELEVYSNTQLNVQSQWRNGATTTVVPLYEFLSVTGREVSIPGGQLYFQVDGWGAANLGSNPWWNGYTNTGSFSADLNLAWVQARFLDILQQASRFEISDSGALLLIAPDGRRITARRPK